MRRFILLRHGKAEVAGLTGGDRERPLAERGRTDCAATARWLLGHGYVPDMAFVSPASRTRATWECASEAFPDARAEVLESLYLASADCIQDAFLSAPAGVATVMIVGHNPGLQEYAMQVSAEARAPERQIHRLSEGFPPSAAVVFHRDAGGAVTLEAVYEPPRRAGDAPRWAYHLGGAGDRV